MGLLTGVNKIGDYATPATNKAKVAALRALLPNPDTAGSSGAVAVPPNGVGNTYLDEMGPMALAQLHVELIALEAAIANA